MGLPREQVAKIRAAGAIHDVGKIKTPIEVLHKEGRLTPEEYAVVKDHPSDGAEMVAALDDPELTAMVRHHHERLDGAGYPDGLRGDAIPLGARILAVADTFDAVCSARPYRHARSHRDALAVLAAARGLSWTPTRSRVQQRLRRPPPAGVLDDPRPRAPAHGQRLRRRG
jgi:HD-GYP domain-containing protein (c-di-GMP phosphodiesterase class II)